MPTISSKAAISRIEELTTPRALYSWITASVAEGSVGAASVASTRLIAIFTATESKKLNRKFKLMKAKMNTKRNAARDSNNVRIIMDFPVDFRFGADRLPPIEKVMKDSDIVSSGSVCSTKLWLIIPERSGFRKIPARMYPEILGNFTLLASSPRIKPANIKIPILRIMSIGKVISKVNKLLQNRIEESILCNLLKKI